MSVRHQARYEALLKEAVAAGEFRPCDTSGLARAIGAISGGSLTAWAIHREGTAERWVKADLATLLAPHTRPPRTVRAVRKRRGRRP